MYLKYPFLHEELKEKLKDLKLKVVVKCSDDQNEIVFKQFGWAHEKSVWQSCYLVLVFVGNQGIFSLELLVPIKIEKTNKVLKRKSVVSCFSSLQIEY